MSLMRKDNERVRHFALRVQQLVKRDGAMKMQLP